MNNKVKCSHPPCKKEIGKSEGIRKPLHFMHGVIPTVEMKKYCSKECAGKDQAAHDL